jgi:iron-sulfur cluster insertion protein
MSSVQQNTSHNAVQSYEPSPTLNTIVFTDTAAAKLLSLIEEENNPALMLRVFITGGGCSGFQYGFTFDEELNTDDFIIEKLVDKKKPIPDEDDEDDEEDEDGEGAPGQIVKLLVDPMSFQYLLGAEIDYKEDLQGSQFVIRNPNAKTTCGCGSSFSV